MNYDLGMLAVSLSNGFSLLGRHCSLADIAAWWSVVSNCYISYTFICIAAHDQNINKYYYHYPLLSIYSQAASTL
jgi:hypothetical protein